MTGGEWFEHFWLSGQGVLKEPSIDFERSRAGESWSRISSRCLKPDVYEDFTMRNILFDLRCVVRQPAKSRGIVVKAAR